MSSLCRKKRKEKRSSCFSTTTWFVSRGSLRNIHTKRANDVVPVGLYKQKVNQSDQAFVQLSFLLLWHLSSAYEFSKMNTPVHSRIKIFKLEEKKWKDEFYQVCSNSLLIVEKTGPSESNIPQFLTKYFTFFL